MNDLDKDIFFNDGIRAIMTAPRGQPSYNLLDAFHRTYEQHEMKKCSSEIKKFAREYGLKENSYE